MRLPAALEADIRTPARWPALDGVRGLAVLSVVVYHAYRLVATGTGAAGRDTVSAWCWPAGTARFALDAFFVLSGFLVVGSWQAIRRDHTSALAAFRSFAWRRGVRVAPAYWMCLLILVPLVAPHLVHSWHGLRDLALLISFQQYAVPGLPAEINTVFWSLTTEVHFYLLVPLVAAAFARFGPWRTFVAAVALTVAWRAGLRGGLPASFIFGRLDQFIAGGLAAQFVRHWDRYEHRAAARLLLARWVGPAVVVIVVGIGTYHGSTMGMARGNAFDLVLHPLVGALLSVLLTRIVLARRAPVLAGRPLRVAGLISYSVYLWHYPLLEAGLRITRATSEAATASHVAGAAAVLVALSFGAGLVSYIAVERSFLQRRQSAAPAADREPALAGVS